MYIAWSLLRAGVLFLSVCVRDGGVWQAVLSFPSTKSGNTHNSLRSGPLQVATGLLRGIFFVPGKQSPHPHTAEY